MIRYVIGDATAPQGEGDKLIVHVVNDRGGWGKGFVLALGARYPQAERAYRRWARQPDPDDPTFGLGEVQFVPAEAGLWVANVLAQRGVRNPRNPVPLDYAALERGLATVAQFAAAHQLTIHMPRIGAGLAGGDWGRIEALIEEQLAGHAVTIYDLL